MFPLRTRWVGTEDDDFGPAFVDASVDRFAKSGIYQEPDSFELIEVTDDEQFAVLTSVDPFRPGIRFEVFLRIFYDADGLCVDVVRVLRT